MNDLLGGLRAALPAALLLLAACAPLDNTGGPTPEGTPLSFEVIDAPDGLACGNYDDTALLLRGEADVDDFLEGCASLDGVPEALRDDLLAELDETDEGDALLVATVVLGGCLGDYSFEGVYLNGDRLRPWLVKEDSSYGRPDVACTEDIGEAIHLIRATQGAEAMVASIEVGVWNPELPGGPEQVL
jgi:hypothetical protein